MLWLGMNLMSAQLHLLEGPFSGRFANWATTAAANLESDMISIQQSVVSGNDLLNIIADISVRYEFLTHENFVSAFLIEEQSVTEAVYSISTNLNNFFFITYRP